jgi:hypothetical protein
MDLEKLKEPFGEDEIEWRALRADLKQDGTPWAQVAPYVESRSIMDRLDKVAGIGNWQNRFEKGPDGGVICGISIRIENEWVTKWDGAEGGEAEGRRQKAEGDPSTGSGAGGNRIDQVKTSLTNAFKRAAVQWGIGRYLYGIENQWAVFSQDGKYSARIRGKNYRWSPPGASTGSATGAGTLKGDMMKLKYNRMREEIWHNCLRIAGGDIEAAKKVLHGYAGIYNWEKLFDKKAEEIYSAVEREAREKTGE